MEDLNNIINKLDLNNIHQTLHSVTADYTFFLSAHRTPNDMDHVLAKKQSNKNLINLKELKSYKAYCLTIMKLSKKSITERYLDNPQVFGN